MILVDVQIPPFNDMNLTFTNLYCFILIYGYILIRFVFVLWGDLHSGTSGNITRILLPKYSPTGDRTCV